MLVIDTICPLIAPHIIITEPPPEDPWIAWSNATNNPQDFGYGKYLAVPSRSVSFVNLLPDHEGRVDVFESPDLIEAPSPVDTPAPGTPASDDGFLGRFGYDEPEIAAAADGLGLSLSTCGTHSTTCAIVRPTCDIFELDDDVGGVEDEGDDLPPFDDWYLSIVERTSRLVLS